MRRRQGKENGKKRTDRRLFAAMAIGLAVLLFACTVTGAQRGVAASQDGPEALQDGIAVLEITLDGYRVSQIERDRYSDITYTLYYDGKILRDQKAQIKGRGNHTWLQMKKPYAVKCAERADWFGFGAARDWVLLANITDQTQMRNLLALTLAARMGISYTPQARPAHVYFNGKYHGLYLITERVEIDRERADLDADGGDLLLELDNNYGGAEPLHFTSTLGNTYVIKDPDAEDMDEKARQDALTRAQLQINQFERALQRQRGCAVYAKYMNMPALVNWFIFNELMKNDDSLFNSSIFLCYRVGEPLEMAPVWDYDLALGGIDRNDGKNVDSTGLMFRENYWGRANWFDYLLDDPDFMQMVQARWTELYAAGVFDAVLTQIDALRSLLAPAYARNYKVWGLTGVFVQHKTYTSSVRYLRDFTQARIRWLNEQWNPSGATPDPNASFETPAPATETPAPATEMPAPTDAPTDAGASAGIATDAGASAGAAVPTDAGASAGTATDASTGAGAGAGLEQKENPPSGGFPIVRTVLLLCAGAAVLILLIVLLIRFIRRPSRGRGRTQR